MELYRRKRAFCATINEWDSPKCRKDKRFDQNILFQYLNKVKYYPVYVHNKLFVICTSP